ncbi:helix-hairpin-helix domain-containing protein [Blastococcus brunescens]|uniref:Helix-hairpin-helix domain-containing protein n=1 Tax=Blastococcus brunescens TaxID=1564165 RepID=A0ABZ1AX00_9ACTN|nr:helix-hairpin-helix domain-containing protein [Blastococcus sp. BMG 8361]WRL61913.1 helix-hairpin-helix domain-containing protein [Blastococcus sp. BMG 8361]
MKQFGSLKRLRAATVEELTAVPGIGRRTAEAVQAAIALPAGEDPAQVGTDDLAETTTAPQGPAERGAARDGSGHTAEVGRVAS